VDESVVIEPVTSGQLTKADERRRPRNGRAHSAADGSEQKLMIDGFAPVLAEALQDGRV